MTPDSIVELVAKETGVPAPAILGRSRNRPEVMARGAVVFVLRQAGWSYQAIADKLGMENHTSTHSLMQSTQKRLNEFPAYRKQVEAVLMKAI